MLKPPPFEGTHYKRWRQKTILWLSSMRCFYVVTEIPATVRTVDEQRQFDHDDTNCRGGLLSIIGDSLIDAYIQLPTVRLFGMLLRPVTAFLMPVLSCTSWSSSMTIGWLRTVR